MKRICVVITARPSYSRVRSVLSAIEAHPDLELLILLAGGSLVDRYGRVADEVCADGFRSCIEIPTFGESVGIEAMAENTASSIRELNRFFHKLQPTAVLSIADRYETLATAIAASYSNFPLIHLQGGEISGSIDDKVRNAVTALADFHFVANTAARRRVVNIGAKPESVFVTGCPSIDLAARALHNPRPFAEILTQYDGEGPELDLSRGYLVVLQHPVTTEHDESEWQIAETLKAVRQVGLPTLWFYPNVDAGSRASLQLLKATAQDAKNHLIRFFTHMRGLDFLQLLLQCKCLIGNSSVGIRECAFLGVPVVNIGTRQLDRVRGHNVRDVAHDHVTIAGAIIAHLDHGRSKRSTVYGNGKSAKRIAAQISSLVLGSRSTNKLCELELNSEAA
jgi:UDP-hydrolysing UDP-N-acetyl-D-glucosamine 2-epimerase